MRRRITAIIIVIACIALAVFAIGAIKEIKAKNPIEDNKKNDPGKTGTLPVVPLENKTESKEKLAHYMVLITDSADDACVGAIEILAQYGIAYTTDTTDFDPAERTVNGLHVYGSYEEDAKPNLTAAIANGDSFYIGIGQNDTRDTYRAENIEAMCRFLVDYIDGDLLDALKLSK